MHGKQHNFLEIAHRCFEQNCWKNNIYKEQKDFEASVSKYLADHKYMKRAACCVYVLTAFLTALTINPKMWMSSCLEQGGSAYLLTPPTHKRCCNCRIFILVEKTSVSLTTQHQNQTVMNYSKAQNLQKLLACCICYAYTGIYQINFAAVCAAVPPSCCG